MTYFWFEQATSYCEELAELFEFCGCWPAYFVPAVPDVLNADPGADAELPGVCPGKFAQFCLGCPVCDGPFIDVDCMLLDGCVIGVMEFAPGPCPANAGADASASTQAAIIEAERVIEFSVLRGARHRCRTPEKPHASSIRTQFGRLRK